MNRFLKWLFNTERKPFGRSETTRRVRYGDLLIDETTRSDGTSNLMLADVEQTIGGVRQLTSGGIDEMVERKHDLQYQLALCQRMMKEDEILPFSFERAAILLRKEKRYQEELEICRYIKGWCERAEKEWGGSSAIVWKSPKLQKCINRIPKIEALIAASSINPRSARHDP